MRLATRVRDSLDEYLARLALSRGSGGGALQNRNVANGQAVGPFVGPTSSVVLAALPVKPVASGNFHVDVNCLYSDSAADTVQMALGYTSPLTTCTGGTVVNGWHVAFGGTVTVVGGGNVGTHIYTSTFSAGNLTQTADISGIVPVPPGVTSAIILVLSATHNLSGMTISLASFELP